MLPIGGLADSYRIASFAAPLSRDGPGLLLRDIQRGKDPQIAAITEVIARISPDVLLLTDFDYDLDNRALGAFALLTKYPYLYASRPNTGISTGLDMDGDGYLGDARDAQGYGRFAGDGGMAILSKVPIGAVTDYSALLWKDLEHAVWPVVDGGPFPSVAAHEAQRLSTAAHWSIEFEPAEGATFTLLAYAATPPVFDGPEDKNGLRNRDELRLIAQMLNQTKGPALVAGNANLDPHDGQGYPLAMVEFLANPRLIDPLPRSIGGAMAADATHTGDPSLDTADWPSDGPGNLRVSYVLPTSEWTVYDAGVFWPDPDKDDILGADGQAAGPHRLVWVDVRR